MSDIDNKSRASTYIFSALFLLLILGMTFLYFSMDCENIINPDAVMAWLDEAGPLAPVLYMLVMAIAIVISPIPSLPLDIMAGAYFGPWLGTLYSATGALIGANISFLIARSLGRSFVERYIKFDKLFWEACSDSILVKVVFFSRLIPFISFDIISYGAGLTRMSLLKFSIATFFGMLPLTFLFTYYGSVFKVNSTLTYVLGFIMVTVFLLLPKWLERSSFKDRLLRADRKKQETTKD